MHSTLLEKSPGSNRRIRWFERQEEEDCNLLQNQHPGQGVAAGTPAADGGLQHKLIQEVKNRWNSTHDMMARLHEQRGPVGAALGSLCTDFSALTSER